MRSFDGVISNVFNWHSSTCEREKKKAREIQDRPQKDGVIGNAGAVSKGTSGELLGAGAVTRRRGVAPAN